tara:strand:- start:421 stop:570 length:150 start_codon:yes stop_codon:yes gene_type:complete
MYITKEHVFEGNFWERDVLLLLERIKELEAKLLDTQKELKFMTGLYIND